MSNPTLTLRRTRIGPRLQQFDDARADPVGMEVDQSARR
jgi:hypothetical protein